MTREFDLRHHNSEKMKVLIIVNPTAGRAKGKSSAELIRRAFRFRGCYCDSVITKTPLDAERIVKDRAKEYDLIACSGGDGTLNETVNGLSGMKSCPPIAYLPSGTTNDFASSLGLSTDIRQALRDTFGGTKRKLDLGSLNDRRFIYTASFGAFSESSYLTPQAMKNRLGRLAYKLECVRELPMLRPCKMAVYDDSGMVSEGEYIFGAVSNSTSIGGILRYSEDEVKLSDGLHEVLLIKKPKSPAMLAGIIRALIVRDYSADGIELFRAPHVRFECADNTRWTLDGERCDTGKIIDIKNIPSAVEFIVPQGAADMAG